MSQKANPTSIGIFVVLGLALSVAGLLLFSSSRLFTNTHDCILYFNDTLNGLSEGAPVKYRGVTIGSVKKVMIRFNQATNDYAMPVIIELQQNLLRERLGDEDKLFNETGLETRVRRGLRGSLQAESLVTGVLYVELRPNQNAPTPVFHQLQKTYPEIPTEPTSIQQLMNNLANFDLKGLGDKLNALLTRLDTMVAGFKTAEISEGITNVLRSVNQLVGSPELTNTLVSVQRTLAPYRELAERLNRRVDPLADRLTNTLAEAHATLVQLHGSAENLRQMLSPDSPLRNDLEVALQQLAGAAQSIAGLAEFLKQHPNALLTGREALDQKP